LAFAAMAIMAAGAVDGCHLFDFAGSGARRASVAWHVSDAAGGTPAFDGASVFFIARDHSVAALDAATGKARWRSPTGTIGAPPSWAGCKVVANLVACGDSGIVGFRRADGALAWRFDVAHEQPGLYQFQVNNGVIFAGSFGRGTVYAIDAATGTARWTAPVLAADPTNVNIPKLATDGDVVVGIFSRGTKPLTGGAVALDAATGAVRWITNFPQGGPDSTSFGVSVALWESFVLASSSDGRIYELDRATGAIKSFFPGVGQRANVVGVSGPVGEDFRPIAVANATLFAASTGSWLIAYSLVQHRELWRVVDPDGASNGSAIVVDGDRVYSVDFNGRLAAFSTTEPKFLWDVGDFQDAFIASPAVGPDKIFVAGLTGFWAIDK
jgi:outer membrane protein assembly factor BamB